MSSSEELVANMEAVCLVEACGSAPFPLQTPHTVHTKVVLVA